MAKFKLSLNSNLVWPLVVLTIALSAFYFKPWQTKPQTTISVQAQGEVKVTPNVARINTSIDHKNPDLNKARQENEKKVNAVIDALKVLGIEDKDIKTEQVFAGKAYQEPDVQIFPAPRGTDTYQFTTSFIITIRNFEIAEEAFEIMTKNGATGLNGFELTLDDESLENAKSQAREKAVENARKKAQELAKASDRKIDKVVKIQEQGDFGFPTPLFAQTEKDLKSQASLIQPGQNEVTVNLQVDFSLK